MGLARAERAHLRRRADLSLPAAAEAKFHDGTPLTAQDVAWSLTYAEGQGPSDHHAVAARLAKAPRRPTIAPWWCVLPKSARATCRCSSPACRSSPRPITPSSRSINRRSMIPLGSGALQGRPLRCRAFHRIRAGEGLVGRRSAGGARAEQFRHHPLRILPRPRGRLRRLHRQELSVPRGVHLAHLGDALRFSRLQGRPRQARRDCRTTRRRARKAGSSTRGARNSRTAACARR